METVKAFPTDLPVDVLASVATDGATITGTGVSGDPLVAAQQNKRQITAVFDGVGVAPLAGELVYVRVPYNGTITGWTIAGDVSGSAVVDVWKDTYANYPPTVTDTIAGSEKPTLSSAIKNEDTSLTTWTTSVTAGDWIAFKVDSASTLTKIFVALHITAST